MPNNIKNNITIICEGTTEYNYLSGLKSHVNTKLNIVPSNADGGDYVNVLKKLKQTPAIGTVARFVLVDFDRYITVINEDKNFKKLIDYCLKEQKKGNPTFLITSNPDFDVFVLKHDPNYNNQDKSSYIINRLGYKSLKDFKNDKKVFEKFNPNNNEYISVSSNIIYSNLIVKNEYSFDNKKFTFKNMSIKFDANNSTYKLSNIIDVIKVL